MIDILAAKQEFNYHLGSAVNMRDNALAVENNEPMRKHFRREMRRHALAAIEILKLLK